MAIYSLLLLLFSLDCLLFSVRILKFEAILWPAKVCGYFYGRFLKLSSSVRWQFNVIIDFFRSETWWMKLRGPHWLSSRVSVVYSKRQTHRRINHFMDVQIHINVHNLRHTFNTLIPKRCWFWSCCNILHLISFALSPDSGSHEINYIDAAVKWTISLKRFKLMIRFFQD